MRWGVSAMLLFTAVQSATGEKLVIVQTNDTHSQIDPTDKGLGGIVRCKVVPAMPCRARCFSPFMAERSR